MISTKRTKADQIQFRAHHAFRLLHVRIPHGSVHVDIVNWYQYAVNSQEQTPERSKLQKCIAHLPRRNALIFGGDYNCPCTPYKHTCGQVVVQHNPLHYVDLQDHQQVWRTLHLTALNTWQRPQHGQVATFLLGEHESAASEHATARSKQASPNGPPRLSALPPLRWTVNSLSLTSGRNTQRTPSGTSGTMSRSSCRHRWIHTMTFFYKLLANTTL